MKKSCNIFTKMFVLVLFMLTLFIAGCCTVTVGNVVDDSDDANPRADIVTEKVTDIKPYTVVTPNAGAP